MRLNMRKVLGRDTLWVTIHAKIDTYWLENSVQITGAACCRQFFVGEPGVSIN